jgi:hypothetical protein
MMDIQVNPPCRKTTSQNILQHDNRLNVNATNVSDKYVRPWAAESCWTEKDSSVLTGHEGS